MYEICSAIHFHFWVYLLFVYFQMTVFDKTYSLLSYVYHQIPKKSHFMMYRIPCNKKNIVWTVKSIPTSSTHLDIHE